MTAPVAAIERDGVVAVVRLNDLSKAIHVSQALIAGGVRAIEFTFTNPKAAEAISVAKEAVGDAGVIGAGSVIDPETARIAILSGAEYIVTPTLKVETITACNRYGIPVLCGALTPTEILTAWESGAAMVKVFPASLGGPRYLKDVLAPLPQVKLIPTGGVSTENIKDFIAAGASAVALGTSLVDDRIVRVEDWDTLTTRARMLRELVKAARESEGRA